MSATTSVPRTGVLGWIALALLLGGAIGTQVLIDGVFVRFTPDRTVQWVRSPGVMRRLAISQAITARGNSFTAT
jgi:hypothetical protein